MRRSLTWILFVTLLGAAALQWHWNEAQYRAAGGTIRRGLFPCSSPVTYSIGYVDPRFGLGADELAGYIREAEAVWEGGRRRDYFEFAASSGEVTVNLIYDRRQAALDKLKAIGLRTDQTDAAYQALKARYDELVAQVDPRQAKLAARLEVYKAGEAAYNATVARYNRRGTATPRQVGRLDAARARLQREFAEIKAQGEAVNADIDLLNAVATTLNQLIVELRLDVEQYRREGAALGVYEEGMYRVNGGFRTIDIYKYTGQRQLVRLFAHEMGHALGLDHVKDPAALMYPLNRGDDLNLFPEDTAELDRACLSPFKRRFSRK